MSQNIASTHLTDEQWAAVDTAITQLKAALDPVLVALAPDQRRRVVRMGDGSEAFVRKAMEVIADNLGLMPRNFDMEEMRRDVGSHDALHARFLRLTQLMEKVRDTDTALGSDAMVAALQGYQSQARRRGRRRGYAAPPAGRALRWTGESRGTIGAAGGLSGLRCRIEAPRERGLFVGVRRRHVGYVGWVEPKAIPINGRDGSVGDGYPPDQVRGQPILRLRSG